MIGEAQAPHMLPITSDTHSILFILSYWSWTNHSFMCFHKDVASITSSQWELSQMLGLWWFLYLGIERRTRTLNSWPPVGANKSQIQISIKEPPFSSKCRQAVARLLRWESRSVTSQRAHYSFFIFYLQTRVPQPRRMSNKASYLWQRKLLLIYILRSKKTA